MSEGIVIALIGFGAAITGGLISGFFLRRKNQAEVTQIITDTALSLIEPLKKRVACLEKQNGRYAKRVVNLMRGIERLLAQLGELGQKPCWTPEDWDPDTEEEQE